MFANSGAEAVENAVKIARKATGRDAIVTFDHAFHGRTLLAMSLTAKVMPYKQGMGPFAPEIYRLPFAYPYRWPTGPDRCAARGARVRASTRCTSTSARRTSRRSSSSRSRARAGSSFPAPGFLKGLAEFCAEHGIVFIADEIQSGMGRAGRWYAIEDEDVVPDLVTHGEVARRRPADQRRDRARRDHGRGARRRARRHVRREPGRRRGGARGARPDRARGAARALAHARRDGSRPRCARCSTATT